MNGTYLFSYKYISIPFIRNNYNLCESLKITLTKIVFDGLIAVGFQYTTIYISDLSILSLISYLSSIQQLNVANG